MEIGWENILADCGSDSVLKLKAECSRQERVFHRPEMRGVATSQAPLLTWPPASCAATLKRNGGGVRSVTIRPAGYRQGQTCKRCLTKYGNVFS